jgi:hypothetical protein
MLAAHPEISSVLGLEGRDYLIERSRFVVSVSGTTKATFDRCDFEKDPLTPFGRFDSIFCSGVLYHLTRPWAFIRAMADVADHLFVCTHFAAQGDTRVEGFEGSRREEFGYDDPLSGLRSYSIWLTLESLERAFAMAGLEVRQSRVLADAYNGPLVNLYGARR